MTEAAPPLPPPELMFRVSGGRDPGPFLQSGRETVEDFAAALATLGKSYSDFEHMLDFGCGCGRVLRWLGPDRPARVSGSDYDEPAVRWVRDNLPNIDARTNGGLPPLTFEDETFDLVIAYSVFTHLDADYQDRWLAELHRVTRPGAILLLTVHGAFNWKYCVENTLKGLPKLRAMDARLQSKGILYWTGDGWEHHFPEFYHSTWHTKAYVQKHWSEFFDVLDVLEQGGRPTQDIVVVRRRDDPPREQPRRAPKRLLPGALRRFFDRYLP